MSVTIKQSPKIYTPAYDPIIYVVTSDKTSNNNFRYVVDVDITGATGTPFRFKYPAHPTLGSAVIDIQNTVKQWVSDDLTTTDYGWIKNSSSFVQFNVSFGEEFDVSTTGTTVYANQTSGTVSYAWNGVLDFLPFNTYNPDGYVAVNSSTGFLTNQPSTVKIRDDENAWLYTMTSGTNDVGFMSVKTYDSNGSIITSYRVANNFASIPNKESRFLRFSCGTRNINLIAAADFTVGVQPIITASVASYTCQAFNNSVVAVSELQTFKVNNVCTKFTSYRFHFLNRLGGFDSFSCIKRDKKIIGIERKTFKKLYGTQTSTAWSYATKERLINQTHVNLKDSITVNSDWIDDNEAVWLEDLLHSPVVYMDDSTYGLVAVNIDTNSYEIVEAVDEKLFNISFTFNYSYERYRQSY